MNQKLTLFSLLIFTQTSLLVAGYQSTLDDYLRQNNVTNIEGHICSGDFGKTEFFTNLLKNEPWIVNVVEIGFNAGHSSEVLLSINPQCRVTSFDIMSHPYVTIGKKYIDQRFPNRHTLIRGNSLKSVPAFHRKNPTKRFDLIFIDGGHDFNTAYHDIVNMRKLASPTTLLILDDLNIPEVGNAWKKAIQEGLVKELQRPSKGNQVWAVGNYLFPKTN